MPLILNSEDLVVEQNRTDKVHNVIRTIEVGKEEDLHKLFNKMKKVNLNIFHSKGVGKISILSLDGGAQPFQEKKE